MAQFDLTITLEYELIIESHQIPFVQKVNEWISQGWQPLGGAFVYEGDLCQAMVREKSKINEVATHISDTEIYAFLSYQKLPGINWRSWISSLLDMGQIDGSIHQFKEVLKEPCLLSRKRLVGGYIGDNSIQKIRDLLDNHPSP